MGKAELVNEVSLMDEWDGEITDINELLGEVVEFYDSGIAIGKDVQLEKWGKNTGARRMGKVYKTFPRKKVVHIKVGALTPYFQKLDIQSELYRNVPITALIQVLRGDHAVGKGGMNIHHGTDRIKIRV